jgi:hypothetical protein
VTAEVKISPLAFSYEMILRLKENRKTQTRRLIKHQPRDGVRKSVFVPSGYEDLHGYEVRCKWEVGQRLYVQEALVGPYGTLPPNAKEDATRFLAEGDSVEDVLDVLDLYYYADEGGVAWPENNERVIPAVVCPRWASRFTLEITGLWPELAGQISPEDAIAEGFDSQQAFWDYLATLYKQGVEEIKKLWFWAIEFKKIG